MPASSADCGHRSQQEGAFTPNPLPRNAPAEHLSWLSERFHRVPHACSRTHEGTGIGLALVQELAKLHGGTISVDRTPDVGTTFTVSVLGGTDHLPAARLGSKPVFASTAIDARAYVKEALTRQSAESA